jgi:sulfur-oxidizing protein SoxZ
MTRAIVTLPTRARQGEVIEIRALVAHPMETGHRPDSEGRVLPRNIIRRFSCRYDGQTVFSADLHAAIAANPLIVFHTVATVTGPLTCTWQGDGGFVHEHVATLQVA